MSAQNRVRIRAELENMVSRPLKQIRGDFDGLAKSPGAQSILAGVGLSAGQKAWELLGGAVSGVTDFIGDSITAASDLNESMSKSQEIFPSTADELERFADKAAASFGIAKQAAIEAGSDFGNLLSGAGVVEDRAEDMSESLVGLAGDLASFNNLETGDVLEKLRSGLTGEAEPLRRVGVFLTDAKMKAKAAELGLGGLHGELTEGEKILARYAIIMDETQKAQGDFARTSDGLANTTRREQAEIENLKAEIGEGLLPLQLDWERGNLRIIAGVAAINDVLEPGTQTTQEYGDALADFIGLLPYGGQALSDWVRDQVDAEASQRDLTHELAHGAEVLDDYVPVVYRASSAGAHLGSILRDLGFEADELDDAIGTLSDAIANELFGDAINAGNEARLEQSIADLREQRREAKRGSPEWIELTGRIAENRQALFELHLEQAQADGPEAVLDFLRRERAQLGKADDAARDYLDTLIRLYQTQVSYQELGRIGVGTYANKLVPLYAHGGPYAGDQPFIAGDEGPELIVPRGTGGMVYDAASTSRMRAGAGGYAPAVVVLQLDGREVGRVVDERLYVALGSAGGTGRI